MTDLLLSGDCSNSVQLTGYGLNSQEDYILSRDDRIVIFTFKLRTALGHT